MKNGIKKEDSLLIYGIAILFMIYHHLFVWGDGTHYSILDNLVGPMTEQRLAWLFRLCIPFYAFISGYGISEKLSQKSISERCKIHSLKSNYLLALKQILKLMKKYWLVYIIFIPMGVYFFNLSLIGPRHFTKSLFGFGGAYNSEWWYIKQYMMMLVLFPIFDFIMSNILNFTNNNIIQKYKQGKQITMCIVLAFGLLFALFRNAPVFHYFITQLDNGVFVFTLVFFVGFICSHFHLFEIGSTNKIFQKIRPFLSILILIGCFSIRWIRAYDAVYCKYDAFITAPIIYALITLFSYLKPLCLILQKLGKYSTHMWLTHTFFCYYYFSKLIENTKISILMFLTTTVLSLITAFLLTRLESSIGKLFNRIFKTSNPS